MLLTVEEAGSLLRIGRTKAYAMAREWRETNGRSGLPVIDLGHVLRVPRNALEELIGADLSTVALGGRATAVAVPPPANLAPNDTSRSTEPEPSEPSSKRQRRRRPQSRITDQLDLFDSQTRAG